MRQLFARGVRLPAIVALFTARCLHGRTSFSSYFGTVQDGAKPVVDQYVVYRPADTLEVNIAVAVALGLTVDVLGRQHAANDVLLPAVRANFPNLSTVPSLAVHLVQNILRGFVPFDLSWMSACRSSPVEAFWWRS